MITVPWQSANVAGSVLIDPPMEEPLTLEEAKLRAGLSWATTDPPDPRDQLMRDHIAAARQQVERDTGLALLTQVRDCYFTTLADGFVTLPSQALPVQEVLSVTAVDPVTGARFATIVPRVAPEFEGIASGVARLKVGWIDAADLRVKAPLLLQAVGLLTAHFATFGRDLAGAENAILVPQGYEEAIASFRLIWVP